MTISETIALAVRHHRERLQLSQAELARRMKAQGFPWYPATVARTESADRPLRLDEAVTLAGVLEVKVQDLYALPEMSDPEIDQLKHELERAYDSYADARMHQHINQGRIGHFREMALRAREKYEDAQRDYESIVEELRNLEESQAEYSALVTVTNARVTDLRTRFERLQRRAQQAALMRNLKPGDEVNVTINNIEPAKTRFTKRADGVIFELVDEHDEVVLRSDAFENEQIAKEQAAFFFDRYATRQDGASED